MVIEDMYVPGKKAQYLYKGYNIITKTVEGLYMCIIYKNISIREIPSRILGDKI